ncbi:hypothetical protein V1264_003323 [Littorina saxatilis]|uniref:Apple domain-containing protein n=1 Tax=Littorina saxatilis TaxID=31220 RepID=A0AAN9G8R0_9CAEN
MPSARFCTSALFIIFIHVAATFTIDQIDEHYDDVRIDDVIFRDAVLFESKVRSKIDCFQRCRKLEGCASVTFIRETAGTTSKTCRGHYDVVTSFSVISSSVQGARTYKRRDKPVNSDWVEKSCTVNSECPATQSVCYEGLCLCTPGYYYSISQNACLTSCAQHDLRGRFFKYANAYISLNNLLSSPSETVAQCFDMCLTEPTCRTVDYDYTYGAGVRDYCSTQQVSALDVPANYWNSGRVGFHHYQRACV